ncbi:MAG: HAD family hydrolase [Bacilli bacterium]|nr:HAD family hydrolase [Bacilli bacterium]
MNKYKIIFVDIDWTILNHKIHDWDYESILALKMAQEKGILVYLCTARPYDSVVHTGLFDLFTPDGTICTNGGVAFVKDEVLFANNIPEDIVKKAEDIANKHSLVIEMSSETDRYFTADANIWVDEYFKSYAETIPPTLAYKNDHVSAMLLFAPEFMDEELIKELPPEIRYYRFDLYGVDMCYFENNKGNAIKRVLEHLSIKKEESIGIGDDYGDIPMFNETGLSIALGNGKEEAKQNATYIAPSIHEHGLALALKDNKVI